MWVILTGVNIFSISALSNYCYTFVLKDFHFSQFLCVKKKETNDLLILFNTGSDIDGKENQFISYPLGECY